MDIGNGYFMMKFDNQDDREKVIKDGPWMINDHYLAVKKWSLGFNHQDNCFNHTMVWVHFPSLNLMYYNEQIIKRVALGIGKLVKINMTTQSVARGRYARVCVEIDLYKPVAPELWMNDYWHVLDYESLHLIYAVCGCYGHVSCHCDQAREEQHNGDGGDSTTAAHERGKIVKFVVADPRVAELDSSANVGMKSAKPNKETVDFSNQKMGG